MHNSQFFQTFDTDSIDQQLGNNYWSPLDVAFLNNHVIRMAAIEGDFHWHSHEDDEMFLVIKGEIAIDTEKGQMILKEGQGLVIPKGMKHRPHATKRALIMLIEPKNLKTTGD